MLVWLEAHPRSGLYPRQLPVPGLHTKWLARNRTGISPGQHPALELPHLNEPEQALYRALKDPSTGAMQGHQARKEPGAASYNYCSNVTTIVRWDVAVMTMTSREFNQSASEAKKASLKGQLTNARFQRY